MQWFCVDTGTWVQLEKKPESICAPARDSWTRYCMSSKPVSAPRILTARYALEPITHTHTQSHKLTLSYTIMFSQWRLSLSQIVENCICILRNLSFRLELEMSPSWLTANQELDGLMGSGSPSKEADYSCWGRKRRKKKNLLEEQVRLIALHHQRGFNSTLR